MKAIATLTLVLTSRGRTACAPYETTTGRANDLDVTSVYTNLDEAH